MHCAKNIDMKHFPFFCSNSCLKRSPKRCLTLSLGFVIQQIFFSLLGSNIIIYAVEDILFVVIIFFTKAVNDTKKGFCLFLHSVEHCFLQGEKIHRFLLWPPKLPPCRLPLRSSLQTVLTSSNGIFKGTSGASIPA